MNPDPRYILPLERSKVDAFRIYRKRLNTILKWGLLTIFGVLLIALVVALSSVILSLGLSFSGFGLSPEMFIGLGLSGLMIVLFGNTSKPKEPSGNNKLEDKLGLTLKKKEKKKGPIR